MAAVQTKISELLTAKDQKKITVSFEFFPPRTEKGEASLIDVHMKEFAKQNPVFIDFTWGAGGTTSEKTPALCIAAMEKYGLVVNMHLTCTNMAEGKVAEALALCRNANICNLVALRGDPPAGQEWKASKEGFGCALDLVKYIRSNAGHTFSIAVAGYPEGHPDSIVDGKCSASNMDKEIAYLKEKVDNGGDYIITQLFYDTELFISFVRRCRAAGITVPILPGLLPMVSYAGLQRMASLCKTFLPPDVVSMTDALKDDEEAFKEYGVKLTTRMCQEILEADIGVTHFHFYTLNMTTSTVKVLQNLGLYVE